jgi:hypothetical protein
MKITIFDLPIEIISLIVTNDFETYRAAILAPGIGPLTCHQYVQMMARDKFITVVEEKYAICYYVGGILHRTDGPAIINKEYDAHYWYQNGLLHRNGGPAIIAIGNKQWYQNGLLHRKCGPAIEYADGSKEWWQHGRRHRDNGPAIRYSDGHKEWIINGQLHRDDGPAIEYANGINEWYHNGEPIDYPYHPKK